MMHEDLQKALTSNHQKLRTGLIVENILPDLRPYLTSVEYLRVESKLGNVDQVDELLKILLTKEDRHFYGLCRVCVRNGYRRWALELQEDAGVRKEEEGRRARIVLVFAGMAVFSKSVFYPYSIPVCLFVSPFVCRRVISLQ